MLPASRLVNETIKTRAAAIRDLASAQNFLAQADKAVGETAMAMIRHNFDLLQGEMAALPTLQAGPPEQTAPQMPALPPPAPVEGIPS